MSFFESDSTEALDQYVPLSEMNDTKTSIVSDLVGGAAASAGQFAASTYNSLVPEVMETNERDLIARLGDNALRVYDEHPDAVAAGSFIGGVLLPSGLALKGVGALRSGMKGINWFSEAGKIDQMGKVNDLIRAGKMASEEYNVAVRSLYLRSAANTLVDNAAMELAVVGTMNAHPYMEDYVKDPVKNFGVSMALGAALTGPFSHVAMRHEITKMGQEAYSEALGKITSVSKPISYTEDYSVQLAQHQNNIDNYKNLLELAGQSNDFNDLTKGLIGSFIRTSEVAKLETFQRMASKDILEMPKEFQQSVMDLITSDPNKFAGINKIEFATAKEEGSLLKSSFQSLFGNTNKDALSGIPLTKVGKEGELVADDLVYSPTMDKFFRRRDINGYGVAADLVQSEDALTKGMGKNWYLVPNYDAGFQKLSETSAFIDADYLRKLKAVDAMSLDDLSKVAVHPEDGAMLNAIVSRAQSLMQQGEDISSLKMVLTENKPNWNKIEETIYQKEIQRITASNSAVGVKPSYLTDLSNNIEKQWDNFDLLRAPISQDAVKLLKGWKSGDGMTTLRKAIDDAFRPSQFASHGTSERLKAAAKELYSSAESTALRKSLMEIADSEGYVYLYRGMRAKGISSGTLESFTTNAAKASEFGTPSLYRVKVSDVYGGIRDIAGRAGYSKSTEILVMSHTRDALQDIKVAAKQMEMPKAFEKLSTFQVEGKSLSYFDKQNMKNLLANSFDEFAATKPFKEGMNQARWEEEAQRYIKGKLTEYSEEIKDYNATKSLYTDKVNNQASFQDIYDAMIRNKEQDIKTMLAMDMPAEVISLRTNVPKDSIILMQQGHALDTIPNRIYTNAADVAGYLSPNKRSIRMGTISSKIPVAEQRAALHTAMADEMDSAIKQVMLSSSKSQTVRDLAEYLYSADNLKRLDALKSGLNEITSAGLGSKAFQSTDFALRNFGVVGEIISVMGKDASHLYNKYTNKIFEPIAQSFSAIIKDKAAVVEFNTARELNASIKGYREFRTLPDGGAQFFAQDSLEPWKKLPDGTKIRNMVPVQYKGGDFIISSQSVIDAFTEMQKAGREFFHMNSSYRQVLGQSPLNDIGFWMPAFNPRNKYISYVFDKIDGSTRLLYGNTPSELVSAEKAFEATMSGRSPGTWQIVRKGEDQRLYNILEGRHDPMFMSVADVNALHGGSSAAAVVPTSSSTFSELANGYEHYIHRSLANHLELYYSDVMSHLDALSFDAQKLVKGQPVSIVQKAMNQVSDAGSVVKNTLLGRGDLRDYVGWKNAQDGIQTLVEVGLQTVNKLVDPIINPVKGLLGKGKSLSDKEFETLTKQLEERGIPNPFKDMDLALAKERFHVENISQAPNLTARSVALFNATAATLLLKVMELGQPLVNMLSLPVLTSAAVQKTFSKEYMGAKLVDNFNLSTTAAMYDGVRYLSHPDYLAKYKPLGKELGIFNPVISEVSETLQMARSFNPGIMQKAENLLNSHTVEMLSKGSTWAEQASREVAFATGVSLARKAYPELGDHGVMTFARNFMDTAIGNYHPAQRPTMFQGTLGTAMGLFQTYMVTLAQQIYRRMELRDYKSLAKMMLTQSSLFGVKSLPGFNQVSEVIGNHFSDANYDLTTGTFRAIPDSAASLILYGLPSNLGPAVYTRGDIQPRLPNIAGGLDNLAAINIMGQAFQAAGKLGKAASEIGDEGAAKAFAEALSMQSISRPLARIAELGTGYSVTRTGNTIAGPEEIYSAQGMLARVFATRGIREAKAREAQYLDSTYKSLDRENRQEAMNMLKNHIRSDTLTPDVMERVQEKYMRTGSPTGWRSAINKAIEDTDSPGVSAVRNHLAPSAPANRMIEDID